jgi:pimeloyl-ACP methyl ester carboxylesterase
LCFAPPSPSRHRAPSFGQLNHYGHTVYTLFVVLAFVPAQPDREIFFRDSVWHQYAELQPGDRVTLVGHSAGATSAAMLAFDPVNKGRVKKVKLMSGVYKVGPFVRLVTLGPWTVPHRAFRGMSTEEASPLYNIPPADADSPVFEIYYASNDLPGLRHQAIRFYRALLCQGYTVTIQEVPARHQTIAQQLGYYMVVSDSPEQSPETAGQQALTLR